VEIFLRHWFFVTVSDVSVLLE